MAMDSEWSDRIKHWRRVMESLVFRPLGEAPLSGFVTQDHLTPAQAAKGKFKPMPKGTPWGAKWEYGWFRCEFTLPREAAGQRIAISMPLPQDILVFQDGRLTGSINRGHPELTLTRKARGGETYRLLMEAYAGHGPRPVDTGPVPHGREPIAPTPATQRKLDALTFGIWNEELFQARMDFETLWTLRSRLPGDSLRADQVDQALKDFTCLVDLELPHEEMMKTVSAGRKRLAGLLDCVNGSTAPEFYAFGHGHLDTAWLWTLGETDRKAARTLITQLDLAQEYPQYKFLFSQPYQYERLRDLYPDLYRRVVQAVRKGQIIPEGGMYVEADTNITSGESLIRQFLYGTAFFRENFGVANELLWIPDVFGYCGQLPQIAAGCGMKYFSTQKIFWSYHGGEAFPCNNFIWQGIDGSEIIAHFHKDYNSNTDPGTLCERWDTRVQKEGMSMWLLPFGHGDGGGGPTREHLEFVHRTWDLEGCPRVRMAHPNDFFREMVRRGEHLRNRYVGELYFQAHRGVQTSQARTKRGNRLSEWALREAEMWLVASADKGLAFPAAEMTRLWKMVLLNQFHDIIPGSSIERVYQQAEQDYAHVIAHAEALAAKAQAKLTTRSKALTVFNSLSWRRPALVELPKGFAGAADSEGNALPVQKVQDKLLARVEVPSCGWTTLTPAAAPAATAPGVQASAKGLENDLLRVAFNDRGEITGIFDKQAQRELAAGVCNQLRMFKDVPGWFDAWDIDSNYSRMPVKLMDKAKVEVVAAGALLGRLRVTRRVHHSQMVQEITLAQGSRRIEFHTVMDWQERHKLLKVAFPVAVHADEAIYEVQFGHVRRPTHASRQFDADRFEVPHQKWMALAQEDRGCAILNDCKYGASAEGNCMSLTLLRAPTAPDAHADLGRQEFTYAFYAWNGPFVESEVIRQAYELNLPARSAGGEAGSASLLSVDAPNVIVESVKPAHDGGGDVIVRLYEAKRMGARCTLSTAWPVRSAQRTNMLEEPIRSLAVRNGRITLELRPFEICTLRLKR